MRIVVTLLLFALVIVAGAVTLGVMEARRG